MNRADRNPYPFHNPRQHVACCARVPYCDRVWPSPAARAARRWLTLGELLLVAATLTACIAVCLFIIREA